MTALPIIERLDIVLHHFVSRGVVPMIHEFTLERPEENFDAGIVPAVIFRLIRVVMP